MYINAKVKKVLKIHNSSWKRAPLRPTVIIPGGWQGMTGNTEYFSSFKNKENVFLIQIIKSSLL